MATATSKSRSGGEGDIARRRLQSQQLVGSTAKRAGDVVKRLVAVQAQDYAGAKWALGLRLDGATDAAVERAFAAGAILRTHVLRPTWHFVTPADIRWLLALTAPRVQAANASMHRKLGLDAATFRRSNAALTRALQGGHPLTRDELRVVLQRARVPTEGEQRMSYLMMRAELDGLVCSGPRRGKQFTYALLDERAPRARALEREEALAELAQRYFASRGPATVQDFAKWSGLTVADARIGLAGVERRLEHERADGRTYWFSGSARGAAERSSPTVHLLSVYDEYVSGYKDRSAIISARHAAVLAGMGHALSYIIVVDGRVVGTWRRRLDGGAVVIRTRMLDRLTKTAGRAVRAAFREYGEFLGMTVRLQRRRA